MAKRNIVLITVDALRADFCGFINKDLESSPTKNIDKIAEDGFVFTNYFAAGVPTFLSFPALFTSRYPSMSLNSGIKLPPYETFVEKLKRQGYKTYAIVDSNPYSSSLLGFSRGFDTFIDFTFKQNSKGKKNKKKIIVDLNRKLKSLVKPLISISFPSLLQPKSNIDNIISIAEEIFRTSLSPIFLWLHFMDVHWPYRYISKEKNLFKRYLYYKTRKKYSFVPNQNKLSEKDIEFMKNMYIESIRFLDERIGPFIEKLIKEQNVIVFFTSDHGEELGERGNFDHQENVFTEVTKIPLLVVASNHESRRIDDLCSNLDFGSFILNNVDTDKQFKFHLGRDHVISETVYPSVNKLAKSWQAITRLKPKKFLYGIRNKHFSLIVYPKNVLVYDRQTDPKELNPLNLAEVKNLPEFMVLQEVLIKHRKKQKLVKRVKFHHG